MRNPKRPLADPTEEPEEGADPIQQSSSTTPICLEELLASKFNQHIPALDMLRDVCLFERRLDEATHQRAEQISELFDRKELVSRLATDGADTSCDPAFIKYELTLTACMSASMGIETPGMSQVYNITLEAVRQCDSHSPAQIHETAKGNDARILQGCLFSTLDEVRICHVFTAAQGKQEDQEQVLALWRRTKASAPNNTVASAPIDHTVCIAPSCFGEKHALFFPHVVLPMGIPTGDTSGAEAGQLILEVFPRRYDLAPEQYAFRDPNHAKEYGMQRAQRQEELFFTRYELVRRIQEMRAGDTLGDQRQTPATNESEHLVSALKEANRVLRDKCRALSSQPTIRWNLSLTPAPKATLPGDASLTHTLFHSIQPFPNIPSTGTCIGRNASTAARFRLQEALRTYEKTNEVSLSRIRQRCEELERQLVDCLALQTKYAQFAANPLLEIHNALVTTYGEEIALSGQGNA